VVTSYTRWLESVPVWANFRQRALETAIAEITKRTDLHVEIKSLERSKHRRVTSVTLRLRSKRCRTLIELAKSGPATSVRPPDFLESMLVDSTRVDRQLSSGFVGYRPNPKVQQTSDYRSKAGSPHTLYHSPEVFDSLHRKRTRRVSKPYRLLILGSFVP